MKNRKKKIILTRLYIKKFKIIKGVVINSENVEIACTKTE